MSSMAWWQPPEDPAEGRLRQQDLAVNLRVAWDLIRKEERERGRERREEGEEEDSIVVGRNKSNGSLECQSSL